MSEPTLPDRLSTATRRRFLTVTGGAAALAVAGALPGITSATAYSVASPRIDPFTLGVASGDPLPDGVVLWTRLAPDPLMPFGGMDRHRSYQVRWEIAHDENFRHIARTGRATAAPEYGHSVHVDVRGLEPAREYFYRFRSGRHISPTGRTKTAPALGQLAAGMTMAFASCQASWEGWFTAHRDLAARRHDVVLFLGDYIYEFGNDRGVRPGDDDLLRTRQTVTLDEYRQRYAYYKTDPDLQAAHQSAPWIVVYDDHEVVNNWADMNAGATPADEFLVRRANGLRAYWENMPLRIPQRPVGPDMQLYRRLQYGQLADFSMLDTRQYRSKQAPGSAPNPTTEDPSRTMLGHEQEAWLLDGLAASSATWKVMGHQTAITLLDTDPTEKVGAPTDPWDGYGAARDRLLGGIDERGVSNVVSVAGDLHRTVVSDLALDFSDPDAKVVATEFVGTSISSAQDGEDLDPGGQVLLDQNPHMKFGNFQRGYVSCTITPDLWLSEFRVCDRVVVPDGTVSTRTTLAVENGVAAIQQA
ncbi:alkaline phosphatase D family protein [Microlunatus sp. Y2014]|uniref:alkaline phosphatase D family protein n=1 Tax=Microlunatus sp. Y2014 TaxID=3418488 RepID=UPI003DA6ECF1